MFKINRLILNDTVKLVVKNCSGQLHASANVQSGKIWRQSVGLPKLQTVRGPLIDLPDYSFIGNPLLILTITLLTNENHTILIRF